MYGDLHRYHLLVAFIIKLLLLMMQPKKTWIYCIQNKSNVFDTLNEWKYLVENEIGKRLKCLRLDNVGEYCNKYFDKYCSEYGIFIEKTVPRTPRENGVSERMNRTIMNHIACRITFTILGRCCRYCCLSNKQSAFKFLGW